MGGVVEAGVVEGDSGARYVGTAAAVVVVVVFRRDGGDHDDQEGQEEKHRAGDGHRDEHDPVAVSLFRGHGRARGRRRAGG